MVEWINEWKLVNSCTLIDIASYKMSYNSETEQKASFMGRKIMDNEAKKEASKKSGQEEQNKSKERWKLKFLLVSERL